MKGTYSLYEAKAKLSAIVRRVREGGHVTVTLHGEPVAEIRPVTRTVPGLDERVRKFEERGVLIRAKHRPKSLKVEQRRPGALQRFLRDRE